MPKIVYEDPKTHRQWESGPIPLNEYEERWVTLCSLNHYFAEIACRGSGKSEILGVRYPLYEMCINRVEDREWHYIAGTRKFLAKKMLSRIKRLADRIPFIYKDKPKSYLPEILQIGVANCYALPASVDAIRGEANVHRVICDEQTAWDLIEDKQFLDAVEPLVAKTNAYLTIFGTPKGQKGFVWTEIFDNPNTKYITDITDSVEVLAVDQPIINKEEVDRMAIDNPNRHAQEFLCKFLLPADSIWGEVSVEDHEEFEVW